MFHCHRHQAAIIDYLHKLRASVYQGVLHWALALLTMTHPYILIILDAQELTRGFNFKEIYHISANIS